MVSAIFLTERETTELEPNAPKVPGRIITTLEKAKEIRPMVEKCITIAMKGLAGEAGAVEFASKAERGSEEWKAWRKSDMWRKWADARSPGITARRRVYAMIRDKQAVEILFNRIAPRFVGRLGGYTRIMRLAKPRLGDNGTRAILEFVGKNDRVKKVKAEKPAFESAAS
jgi:large subunit ribosomal protein L17